MKVPFLLALMCATVAHQAFSQCPTGETQVTMTVVTDAYGSETTWSVTGPGGSPTYASGGPYANGGSINAFPQTPVSFCVPDGSTFHVTVNDSYGDGMCCTWGNGSWTIAVNGQTVGSGGSFTSVETVPVSLGTDLGVSAFTVPRYIAPGNTIVKGTVRNYGTAAVSGYTLSYSVDGGSPVSQNFSGSIAPGASANFSFATPWNAAPGGHMVDFVLTGVSEDALQANNTLNASVSVASQTTDRTTIIEEFTSSTCPACASFNSQFIPVMQALNTNVEGSGVVHVNYQMNWPGSGNDPSYNPDGATRRSYYGVSGLPDPIHDGGPLLGNSYAAIQNNIAAATSKAALVDLDVSYVIDGNKVTVTAVVTPYFNFPAGMKLHIAVLEKEYHYPGAATSQKNYFHVMRKMMPNGNDNNLTALVDGVSQTVTRSHTFGLSGTANPVQGSYDLWGGMDGIEVVAFIQHSDFDILQAALGQVAVGISETAQNVGHFSVFPNPANDAATVQFSLKDADRASVEIYNMQGALVGTQQLGPMVAGAHRIAMDTQGLPSGIYLVNLVLTEGRVTQRLIVNQ
jgi:thiol-disulfide isomerase/thioredoxin